MFHARTFIFDNIPSERYNVYLGESSGSGESSTDGSSDVALLTEKLFRRPMPLFYGTEQIPVLQFPLSMYCPDSLDAPDYSDVSSWLFGQQGYRILRICQNDMVDIYYRCFLTNPKIIRFGNFIRSITCTVVCDSPWAWKMPKTYIYEYPSYNYSVSETINIFNESKNNFYTYPRELNITVGSFGGIITITNTTDSNTRIFTLGTALLPVLANDVITINCDLQQISSDLETYPLSKFNGNWLRLLKGLNTLSVAGNIVSLSILIPIGIKVGG